VSFPTPGATTRKSPFFGEWINFPSNTGAGIDGEPSDFNYRPPGGGYSKDLMFFAQRVGSLVNGARTMPEGVIIWYEDDDPAIGYAVNVLSHILGPARLVPRKEIPLGIKNPAPLILGIRESDLTVGGLRTLPETLQKMPWVNRIVLFVLSAGGEGRILTGIAERSLPDDIPHEVVLFPLADGMPRRNEIIGFGLAMREKLLATGRPAPEAFIRKKIEEFLSSHHTCTLCTGSGSRVRASPAEYHYHDGTLVILSEGGEKFAHILLNPRVSVAIYTCDGKTPMAGMQIQGEATMVTPGTSLYRMEIGIRGMDPDRVMALPYILHMILVKPGNIEFCNPVWQKEGYDIRQVYRFG